MAAQTSRRSAGLAAAGLLLGSASGAFAPPAARAGILSGASGIESTPPPLPPVEAPDFLKKMGDAQRKKYADFDENLSNSPILAELLKKSKDNKEKNKQEIANKYCARGAEWGVGDCSLEGLSVKDREAFREALTRAAAPK